MQDDLSMSQITRPTIKTKKDAKLHLPDKAECLTCGELLTQEDMGMHIDTHTIEDIKSGFIDGAFYLHPLLKRLDVVNGARQ